MTDDGADIVLAAYAAWNEGRGEDMLAAFHTDVVYFTSGVFPGFDSEYRGREGMARFRAEMLEAWEEFHLDPLEVSRREDGLVTVALNFRGVGRGSGVEVEVRFHHAARLRDGLIDRFAAHPDLDTALSYVA